MINDQTRDGIEKAAALLATAHSPLFVAGRIDLAAAAGAVELARATGGLLDQIFGASHLAGQEQGTLGTVPGEAFVRADLVLVAAPVHEKLRSDEAFRRLMAPRDGRTVIGLGKEAPSAEGIGAIERFDLPELRLEEMLGVLHALAKEQKTSLSGEPLARAEAFVRDRLLAAQYGVFVFDPDLVSPMAQFMMMALADTLSAKTRWTVLALGRLPGSAETTRMAQALTGLTTPLSFAAAKPVYDPHLYRAPDVVARGEADAVVWISGDDSLPPDWLKGPPMIAITARPDAVHSAKVQISVGQPGIDHDGLVELAATGFVAGRKRSAANAKASAGEVLDAIRNRLAELSNGAAA